MTDSWPTCASTRCRWTSSRSPLRERPTATTAGGSGHAAGLNFGDCFAYALAATTGEPVLFTGDDFTHTDVLPVV